jgi:hypothetical protein
MKEELEKITQVKKEVEFQLRGILDTERRDKDLNNLTGRLTEIN